MFFAARSVLPTPVVRALGLLRLFFISNYSHVLFCYFTCVVRSKHKLRVGCNGSLRKFRSYSDAFLLRVLNWRKDTSVTSI